LPPKGGWQVMERMEREEREERENSQWAAAPI
jgi:hypothetical protein